LHGRITAHHRRLLKLHLDLIEALEQALREVDADVGKLLAPIRECARLLTTMPGVNELTAHVMVAKDRRRHGALPHPRASALLGHDVPEK
jgi:transposase